MRTVRPSLTLGAVALAIFLFSACGSDDDPGGSKGTDIATYSGATGSVGASGADTSSCGPAEQEACALLATIAGYMERMAGECGGAYAVPTECSGRITYDDVETYASESDGADLPGTVAYVTVNDDLTDYVASLSGAGEGGESVHCSVHGSDRTVTCEPL